MRWILPLCLAIATSLPAAPAQALAPCYAEALTQMSTETLIRAASGGSSPAIAAHRWLRMRDEQRRRVHNAEVVSALDSQRCRRDRVIKGGVRINDQAYGVPYGFLYELYATALQNGQSSRVKGYYQHARPARKNADALLNLVSLVPPRHVGSWATAERLFKVFELEMDQKDYGEFGLLMLFEAMGGSATYDCDRHTVPETAEDDYDRILAYFGLDVGLYERPNEQAPIQFKLEDCIQ